MKKSKSRPVFRNIGLFRDLPMYVKAFPPSAYVSVLHRVSGLLLFLLLPALLWVFDASLRSEESFSQIAAVFSAGLWGLPGWVFKLVVLVVIWAFLHHFCAGIRHLVMDVSHAAVSKKPAMTSARVVLVVSLALTVVLGAKLFGVF